VTYWQESLREAVTTVDELVKRFGIDHIDQKAVQQAIDGFNLRITPELLQLIREPGDPIWRQYVPTPEENEVVDGIVDSRKTPIRRSRTLPTGTPTASSSS
jgi:lysine 2,3-aminomutase